MGCREFKGNSLLSSIDEYVVFDLETTGLSGELREIIEIAAVRIRHNEIADKFQSFVKPSRSIPFAATAVNGITDSMVMNAPPINELLPAFLDFIEDNILIGHNISSFDIPILYDKSEELGLRTVSNDFIDTFRMARRCLPELPNHRLETIAQYLGIETIGLHRALNDCEVTHNVYQDMKELIGYPAISFKVTGVQKNRAIAKVDSDSVKFNFFDNSRCIVYGAFKNLEDGQIKDIINLVGGDYVDFFTYSANYAILGKEMFQKYLAGAENELFISLRSSPHIKVISETDFYDLANITFEPLTQLIPCYKTCFDVNRMVVCLTGEFVLDTRANIESFLRESGAVCKKDIIKSTDYLIIGGQGSENWKFGNYGNKTQKALKMQASGSPIKIISESEFFKTLELTV